jgi:hypothetical protein
MIVSLLVLDPILMFGFKVPIYYCGLAYYGGPLIISLILFALFFRGVFPVKLLWRSFFSKPSPELKSTLLLSLPQIAAVFLSIVGNMGEISFVNKAAQNVGKEYADMFSTVVLTASKPTLILSGMITGINTGFRSCAPWAFQKGLIPRLVKLYLSALLIGTVLFCIIIPVLIAKPTTILNIWLSEEYNDLIKKIVPLYSYGYFLEPFLTLTPTVLMVVGSPLRAMVSIVLRYFLPCLIALVLYYITPNKPLIVSYVFLIGTVVGLIILVCLSVRPFIQHFKGRLTENGNNANIQTQLL